MKNKSCTGILFFILVFMLAVSSCKAKRDSRISSRNSPNILFILIDDLGYKDLSCYGSEFYETPHIDRLAAESAVFINAYSSSAVCSPTRASILTGEHPARLHLTDWTGPEKWHPHGPLRTPEIEEHLSPDDYTIAEALHDHGYATCFLGKWHLGPKEYYPDKYGFDIELGATSAGAPPSYFFPYFRANWAGTGWPTQIADLVPGGEAGEYLTDRLTDEALNFIDTVSKPFFLYLSHYAVHKPLEAKAEKIRKYHLKADSLYEDTLNILIREKNNTYVRNQQSHSIYAAMIESVDESVGRLLARLKKKGIDQNTIIIFTSDNGGYSASNFPLEGEKVDAYALSTSISPYRAGKGWYYEGGIKVPTIIYWPGVTKSGTTIDQVVTSTDFYPTILSMTNIKQIGRAHV